MMATTLYERLQSDDPGVRRVAVLDLPYSDEADDIVPLLVVALSDPDACVRLEAAKAIEGYEEPDVLEALVPLLKDADSEVRRAAAIG